MPGKRLLSVSALILLIASPVSAADVTTGVFISQSLPGDPTFLDASAAGPIQVILNWSDNSTNEDGFQVERRTGVGIYAQIATTTASVATYTDNSALPNTQYTYRVRAYNSDGSSNYSNEDTVTTPASGGGGGGGGGGYVPSPAYVTKAVFRGLAYPTSDVTLLRDAQVIATTRAGPDARFQIEVESLSPGTYMFGVWAEDRSGNRSAIHTFSISITLGATTVVSGIFIPPILGIDKLEVRRGDPLTFYGTTAPGAQVSVLINSEKEILKNTTSSEDGTWSYRMDSLELEYGDHTARSRAAKAGELTTFSGTKAFKVGDRNVLAPQPSKCPRGDLNKDCKVNLVDFSIMAYWYKRELAATGRSADLNGDGKITLVDFSILAFHWTG